MGERDLNIMAAITMAAAMGAMMPPHPIGRRRIVEAPEKPPSAARAKAKAARKARKRNRK